MFKEFDSIVSEYKKQDIFISDQSLYDKKVEFIYNSNKLEGNLLDYKGTESVIRDRLCFTNEVRFRDILEVKGQVKALDNCLLNSSMCALKLLKWGLKLVKVAKNC